MSGNIQSAEEFLREWFNEYASEEPSGLCDPNWQELMARIEARDAAQRQAGREEREGELKAMHDAWCDDMKERYTAVVEAARWIADEDITETERIIIGMDKIRKALSDLGEARGR